MGGKPKPMWTCNACGTPVAAVGRQRLAPALREHQRTCLGDHRGIVTLSIKRGNHGR